MGVSIISSATCCCGTPDCSTITADATANPQICRVTTSYCDHLCRTGTFVQEMVYQVPFGSPPYSSWAWNVLPRLVTLPFDPDNTDDECLYCSYVNGFGFTEKYYTGRQIGLSCVNFGEHIGEWELNVTYYRRGDDERTNCDDANENQQNTITSYITGISVNGSGQIVGGPYTVTLTGATYTNFNDTSGDSSDIVMADCDIVIEFGPP